MTTNEDRAQHIVGGVIDRLATDKSGVPVATRITQALADAGLLMPDQPESSWPNGIPTNDDSMSSLYTSGGKVYACINAGYDSDNEELAPDEAIEWAYDLLAAARQAQKEQGNG